jgi:hypothetical protein
VKKFVGDRTAKVPSSRHSGAPALNARDFLESPKGRATIRKAAKFADRLKLESVGQLPLRSSDSG